MNTAHHPAVDAAIANAPLAKRAAYDAAVAAEEDARLEFNNARHAALNAAPLELWMRADNAVCDAIDAAPEAERKTALAAADNYLAAIDAADAAYKAVIAAAPEKERKAIDDAQAAIDAIDRAKAHTRLRERMRNEMKNMSGGEIQ